MSDSWTRASSSEYIDIHSELLPYQRVLDFFEKVESEFDVLKYCSGANDGGRWIFQIYSIEFVNELADLLNSYLKSRSPNGTILEVMSGDGRLSEFLKDFTKTNIISTDARIGNYGIAYPKWVENLDAIEALRAYKPNVVILAWEPFYSSVGLDIVETGTPTIWIGDRRHSAVNSSLFDKNYIRKNSRYALGRHDSFAARQFETDVYLFNWDYDND
ncbi:MAG: hypothetical protein ACFFEA_06665 [Candidatus Thorarchaeota archaeon]